MSSLQPAQVCACANDGDSSVREAAARCITQFADHLQPEILDYHAVVLPQLFKCLGTMSGRYFRAGE